MQIGKYLWNAYNVQIFSWEQREYKDDTACFRSGEGRAQSRKGSKRQKGLSLVEARNGHGGTQSPKRRVQLHNELEFSFILVLFTYVILNIFKLYTIGVHFQNCCALLPYFLCDNLLFPLVSSFITYCYCLRFITEALRAHWPSSLHFFTEAAQVHRPWPLGPFLTHWVIGSVIPQRLLPADHQAVLESLKSQHAVDQSHRPLGLEQRT